MYKKIISFWVFICAVFVLSACEVTCEVTPGDTIIEEYDISIDVGAYNTNTYAFTARRSGYHIISVYNISTGDDLDWFLYDGAVEIASSETVGNADETANVDLDSGVTYDLLVTNMTASPAIYDLLVEYNE